MSASSQIEAIRNSLFYKTIRRPLLRTRIGGPLGSNIYRALPDMRMVYPGATAFNVQPLSGYQLPATIARTGLIDTAQPTFGYFSGGGWAFGLIENSQFRINRQAYVDYAGPNGDGTNPKPVGQGVVVSYDEYYVDGPNKGKIKQSGVGQRTLIVGQDIPHYSMLLPGDTLAVRHDFEHQYATEQHAGFLAGVPGASLWNATYTAQYKGTANSNLATAAQAITWNDYYNAINANTSYSDAERHELLSMVAYSEVYMKVWPATLLAMGSGVNPFFLDPEEVDRKVFAEAWKIAEARGLDPKAFVDVLEEASLAPNGFAIAAGWVGEYFGSQLGNYVFGDTENFGELVGAAFLNSVGADVGKFLSQGVATGKILRGFEESIEEIAGAFGPDFPLRLQETASGAISTFLTMELSEALGLEGFGAELFANVGGTVLSHVVDASLQSGANLFQDFVSGKLFNSEIIQSLPGAAANALGAFLGAKLGSLVVQPETQAAVVLSSLGSAAGSALGAGFLSGLTQLGALGGPVGAFVGAFAGFVLGALFGNMFGRKKPRIPAADAQVVLQIPSATYALGTESQVNNGNLDLVRTMAISARDTLNGISDLVTRGDEFAIVANTTSPTQVYGHTGGQLWVKLGGTGAAKTNVNSADEAVDKGVLWALPATKIIGGDLYLKRVLYNIVRHPNETANLATLLGNLQTADDYGVYLQAKPGIDAAIAVPYNALPAAQKAFYDANQPFMTRALAKDDIPLTGADLTFYNANKPMVDSIISGLQLTQFAAGWIITLQRAAELELDRAAPSDFYGGAKGFVDSLGVTMLGQHVDYESVGFRMEGSDLVVRYAPELTSPNANLVPDGDVPGNSLISWWSNGANAPFQETIETVDGARALVISKSQTYYTDANGAYSGSVALQKGDRADGWYSVAGGERVGFAIEAKSLQGATHVNTALAFWDAAGAFIGHQAWTTASVSSWARFTGVVNAPANAAFATVEVWARNAASQTGLQKIALKNLQFHRLPAGASVPAWSGAPYETFIEPNFAADAGFSIVGAGANTSGNDYTNLSASASAVTIDDTRMGYVDQWTIVGYDEYGFPIWGMVPTWTTITGGDDIFIGGLGADTLNGRAGHDWLDGGAANDTIYGGTEDDVLLGRAGVDNLQGEAGNDTLLGGDGNDTLTGGDGNDTVDGGTGTDTANGGNGDDMFLAAYSAMAITGGANVDTISYRTLREVGTWSVAGTFSPARPGVFLNFTGGVKHGAASNDTYTQVENLEGSQFQDFLGGDATANKLSGLGDDDKLLGYDGNDIIEGGAGADQIEGGNGSDTASYERSQRGVWLDMTLAEYGEADAEGDTLISIENLTGSDHADTIKGNSAANVLKGLKGDDWFVVTVGGDSYDGGDDFDVLDFSEFATGGITVNTSAFSGTGLAGTHVAIEQFVGTAFNDVFTGGTKDEWFQAGKGNDTLNGGTGSDTYIFHAGDGADTITDTKDHNNTLVLGDGLTWSNVGFSTTAHLIVQTGGGHQVQINNNFATLGNNVLKFIDMGGAGSIDISQVNWAAGGTSAANTLTGGTGTHDFLFGFEGNDTLRGSPYATWEDKHNVFIGGTGNDYIVASIGDDQYVFERGHGKDTIYDGGGIDSIVFGPTVASEDVIFSIDGADLIVAIRDLNNPTWTALQVWNNNGDAIRVLEGGAAIYQWVEYTGGGGYYTGGTINTIEHIIAGGTSIDLMKLDIPWGTATGGGGYYPVVFDLGGDGLDLISVDHSDVVIKGDDPNAPMMRVGWVDGQDGMLAIDRNGDGEISRISEISFKQELKGAKTDMEGLAALDSNGDGRLDASDKRWGELKLWRDVNQNGVGTGKEVVSLEQAGIVAIELKLSPTGFDGSDTLDNVSLNTAVFHWANGKTGTVHDVALGSKLAHIEGRISGKWREEWSGQPQDGALGRAKSLDGRSDPTLVSAKGLEHAPEQRLGFAQDRAMDGVADLPAIVRKKGGALDVQAEIDARNNGGDAAASAGSAAPIIIDLGGDGVDLIAPENSPVFFDLNQDGWMDQLGWVGANDGILALDRDGDNRISLINEISFVGDKPGATTDLEGLAAFDSDGDSALTSTDERWSSFKVWRDVNQDGRSTSSELMTLEEAGVTSINLAASSGAMSADMRTMPWGEATPLELLAGQDVGSFAASVQDFRQQMRLHDSTYWQRTPLGFEIAHLALDPNQETSSFTAATAAAVMAGTPGGTLQNHVHGQTTVQLSNGSVVTGLDVALGSISGIELAIRATQIDTNALLGRGSSFETNPNFAPWALNSDIRRMLAGGDLSETFDTPAGSPAMESLEPGKGERVLRLMPQSIEPLEDPIMFSGAGGYDAGMRNAPAEAAITPDAVMDDASLQNDPREARRWWSRAPHNPAPFRGTASLAHLMAAMGEQRQTVADGLNPPRGRDRAIPLDPDMARSAHRLRDAIAAFGDTRNGAETRTVSTLPQNRNLIATPSAWQNNKVHHKENASLA